VYAPFGGGPSETDHWYRAGRLPYCEDDAPSLTTHVATTAWPTAEAGVAYAPPPAA
jgi:hypothetical protein